MHSEEFEHPLVARTRRTHSPPTLGARARGARPGHALEAPTLGAHIWGPHLVHICRSLPGTTPESFSPTGSAGWTRFRPDPTRDGRLLVRRALPECVPSAPRVHAPRASTVRSDFGPLALQTPRTYTRFDQSGPRFGLDRCDHTVREHARWLRPSFRRAARSSEVFTQIWVFEQTWGGDQTCHKIWSKRATGLANRCSAKCLPNASPPHKPLDARFQIVPRFVVSC